MKQISNPIVFFGTEVFSLVALRALVDAGFNVAAVITKPDSPQGRGYKLTPPAVKSFAIEHGIPVWQPAKLTEVVDNITALDHPVGVLVSYGKIIPQSIIDVFVPGIINVHPSLLPKYRGPSPIETAILNGDSETGVTIMQLSAAMDAGPIYRQTSLPLQGDETAEDLYESLGIIGTDLLIELLPSIVDGSMTPQPQNDAEATYCHLLNKSDGAIDWNEDAETIEARLRAYHIWPQNRSKLGDVEVIITKAKIVEGNYGNPGTLTIRDNELLINTGKGILSIISVKPLGKKEMPVSAFLSGYHSRLGI